MTQIPQEAIDAARGAVPETGWNIPALRKLLEAAAPHIAAAERERIRHLADEHRTVAAVDCQCEPVEHEPDAGHYVRFTDLLTDPEQTP